MQWNSELRILPNIEYLLQKIITKSTCVKRTPSLLAQEVRIFTFRPKNIRTGYHIFVLSKPHIRQLKPSKLARQRPRSRQPLAFGSAEWVIILQGVGLRHAFSNYKLTPLGAHVHSIFNSDAAVLVYPREQLSGELLS